MGRRNGRECVERQEEISIKGKNISDRRKGRELVERKEENEQKERNC